MTSRSMRCDIQTFGQAGCQKPVQSSPVQGSNLNWFNWFNWLVQKPDRAEAHGCTATLVILLLQYCHPSRTSPPLLYSTPTAVPRGCGTPLAPAGWHPHGPWAH